MRFSLRLKALLSTTLVSLFVLSCGGGGSGGEGDLELPGLSDATISLSIVDNTDSVTTILTDSSVTFLAATLLDSAGDPIENASLVFRLDSDIGRLTDTASATDSLGETQVQVFAGLSAGLGSAQVIYTEANGDKVSSSVSFTSLGDESDPDDPDSGGDTGSGGSVTSSTGSTTITLSLVDLNGASAGTSGNPITSTSAGVLTATLVNSDGPVVNEVVTFASDIGTLSPSTQLTDSNGQATINVNANGTSEAGTVTASATVNGDTIARGLNFVIGVQSASTDISVTLQDSLSVSAGTIDNPISSINPGILRATLADVNGNPVVSQVVTFTADIGTVSPVTQLTDASGVATIAYTAGDTAGAGTIVASTLIGFDTFSDEISIVISEQSASAEGTAIEFVNASPVSITLKGTGGAGLKESSVITFKVVDTDGQPVSGQSVAFELTTSPGGLEIASNSDVSDVSGNVTVTVNSGTIPVVVRVSASFTDSAGDLVSVYSDQLTVSTGLPEQSRFSVVVSNVSPQAGSHDGVTVTVTAFSADRSGNPAPDGTAVYFTSELGFIGPNCPLLDGSCSVTWTSIDARDAATDQSVGGGRGGENDRFGRSSILAVTVGEEAFIDNDSNGVFDVSGDVVVEQLAEAFRDDNETFALENGVVAGELDEEFRDYIVNGTFDSGDLFYNGARCSDDALAAGHCAGLIEVRDEALIVMSTDSVRIIFVDSCSGGSFDLDYVSTGTNPPSAWGAASISVSGATPEASMPSSRGSFGFILFDSNANAIPGDSDVVVSISPSTGGTLVNTSFTTSTGESEPICHTVGITPPATGATTATVNVLVTLPDGQVAGAGALGVTL